MNKNWIGIVGTVHVARDFENRLWWCFPVAKAAQYDNILMYCPRAANEKYQGIFALCQIATALDLHHEKNYNCFDYGGNGRTKTKLVYAELSLIKRFEKHLTAKELKADTILRELPCVRRNFQGTTFEVDQEGFDRIKTLLTAKNSAVI